MKHVAMLNTELTVEERNLLSVGYKNVIYSRRAAWRSVSSMEQKVESKTRKWQLVRSYRTEIEGELETICVDLLQLLETHLLPATTSQEAKVLYHKMYVRSASSCKPHLLQGGDQQGLFMKMLTSAKRDIFAIP